MSKENNELKEIHSIQDDRKNIVKKKKRKFYSFKKMENP